MRHAFVISDRYNLQIPKSSPKGRAFLIRFTAVLPVKCHRYLLLHPVLFVLPE